MEIHVVACEDLILLKLLTGRVIDKADAASILRINRASVDCKYLRNWAEGLFLVKDLTEIWEEAFPGEPLPE